MQIQRAPGGLSSSSTVSAIFRKYGNSRAERFSVPSVLTELQIVTSFALFDCCATLQKQIFAVQPSGNRLGNSKRHTEG